MKRPPSTNAYRACMIIICFFLIRNHNIYKHFGRISASGYHFSKSRRKIHESSILDSSLISQKFLLFVFLCTCIRMVFGQYIVIQMRNHYYKNYDAFYLAFEFFNKIFSSLSNLLNTFGFCANTVGFCKLFLLKMLSC